jgi:hypothetical protein
MTSSRANIVKVAIGIIAGLGGRTDRARRRPNRRQFTDASGGQHTRRTRSGSRTVSGDRDEELVEIIALRVFTVIR